MRILLDDKVGKKYHLNANEVCVYSAIQKCTQLGKGWYANYMDLAHALPFEISRMTVQRAIEKLTQLGLVKRDENDTFFCVQNVQGSAAQNVKSSTQNVQSSAQNVQNCAQNVLPLNNPPIYNNNNNNNKQSSIIGVDSSDDDWSEGFDIFWKLFDPSCEFISRKEATAKLFDQCSSAKQKAIIKSLRDNNNTRQSVVNPYFYVSNFPEPKPTNYNGNAMGEELLRQKKARTAFYNGKWGLYTLEDIQLFNLQIYQG